MSEDFEIPPKVAGILDQQLATMGYLRVLPSESSLCTGQFVLKVALIIL
jgi:hypothetical protein